MLFARSTLSESTSFDFLRHLLRCLGLMELLTFNYFSIMKPILVTGGAGYIGSQTCKELNRCGYLPVTVDNLVNGHQWAVKWGPFINADLSDTDKLLSVFKQYKPLAVIHFAAFAYVGESIIDPGKYYLNNVANTINLLSVMKESGCNRVIFSSSCATYGNPEKPVIDESHRQDPVNPYGRSKLMVEKILGDFGKAYEFESVILRYFNASGADPEGDIGEVHDPETHLIPLALSAATGGEPLKIFGTDYNTPDGTAIRDFIHVWDLSRAHCLALEYLLDGCKGDSFNLGTGSGNSVLEVIRAVERVSGAEVKKIFTERRPGDPDMLVASAEKAHNKLGWKCKFINLDSIIETAWKWHLKNLHQ